jgi:hypothetical protein
MSDTDGKVKLIKNPDRNKPAPYKPYVPQYQVHGKDPQEYQGGAVVPGAIARPTTLPSDNPRARRVPVRQPYAEAITSPIGRGRGPVPNVGNNMEHTWSSVDGEIVDDLSGQEIDPNQEMVDNNDFVSDSAFGYQSGPTAADIQPNYQVFPAQAFEKEVQANHIPADPEDLLPVLTSLEEDDCLLIVSGVPVCSGPKDAIEDQARALVFGEHEMCDGNPVPVDDIIILKRVKVKVGLFLE